MEESKVPHGQRALADSKLSAVSIDDISSSIGYASTPPTGVPGVLAVHFGNSGRPKYLFIQVKLMLTLYHCDCDCDCETSTVVRVE